MAKSALGKGLGALIAVRPPAPSLHVEPEDSEKIRQISIDSITPSPLQPRKEFAADSLQELVESIRQHGIIQPLVVRAVNGRHELIAGERRWRAARQLGLTQVPVIVRIATDRTSQSSIWFPKPLAKVVAPSFGKRRELARLAEKILVQ